MRALTDLIDTDDPAWPGIEAAVAAAPIPVAVLAADPRRADDELLRLQVTTRSWLGAVAHRSGGLVLDHGWLRVLGSGHDDRRLAALGAVNAQITGGGLTGFYEDLRWPGWADEVAACPLDQAISTFPPLWTREGKDLTAVSRRPVPMAEVMSMMGATG
jgi:hypothetical protein